MARGAIRKLPAEPNIARRAAKPRRPAKGLPMKLRAPPSMPPAGALTRTHTPPGAAQDATPTVARSEAGPTIRPRGSQLVSSGAANGGAIAALAAAASVVQRQRNKQGGRPRKKDFKNARANAALMKRQGGAEPETVLPGAHEEDEPPSIGLPEDPSLHRTEPPRQRYNRPSKRQRDAQRRAARTVSTPARDDSQLHLIDPDKDTTRVYRVEVDKFDPRYSHVGVSGGRASLYNPPPDPSGTLPMGQDASGEKPRYRSDAGGYRVGNAYIRSKKTPKKGADPEKYARQFLHQRQHMPQGTMSWINFGQADRAVEFHHQKSTNPTEKAKGNTFSIKSFAVPSGTVRGIFKDTVHERDRSAHPTKAINVDRAAPNQLGLQQHHIDLLNHVAVPDSARTEDPTRLAKKVGFTPPKKVRAKTPNTRPSLNRGAKSRRGATAADLDESLAAEEDARREAEED